MTEVAGENQRENGDDGRFTSQSNSENDVGSSSSKALL